MEGTSRAHSLPSLGRSPLSQPLHLVTADVKRRSVATEAIGAHGRKVKLLHEKRMPFVAFERGVEWERPHLRARLPKDPLPPLGEVLRAIQGMNLDFEEARESRASSGYPHQGKKPRVLGGSRPRLANLEPLQPVQAMRRGSPDRSSPARSSGAAGSPQRPKGTSNAAEKSAPSDDGRASRGESTSSAVVAPATALASRAATPAEAQLCATLSGASSARTGGGGRTARSLPADTAKVAATTSTQDADPPFRWTDAELRSVFTRFDTDHDLEVHKDDLPDILRYMGTRQNPTEARRIADTLTKYATLSFEEFNEFVIKFRDWDLGLLRQEFQSADANGNGYIDLEELHRLLHEAGYAPTVQSTLEALAILDKNKDGNVDFLEFELLREHLRKTEGMTADDVEELQRLYRSTLKRSADSPRGGAMADEVWRITTYLGYPAPLSDIRKVAARVDTDGSGDISFPELLKVVRDVREMEKDRIEEVLKQYGDDPTTCPIEDLGIVLVDLGYFVNEDTAWDILDEIGTLKNEDSLDLDEFASFLRQYRKSEGFCLNEIESFRAIYNTECKGDSGGLRTLDVGRILRWSGFTRTVQQVQYMVAWIDFDMSGELEFGEFLKLMRRMHQDEARARKETFEHLKHPVSGNLPSANLASAVAMLQGVEPNQIFLQESLARVVAKVPHDATDISEYHDAIQAAVLPPFLDWEGYEAFMRHYRGLVVEDIKNNAGYAQTEVDSLRETFNGYDKDGGGTLERAELVKMLSEYFPDATKSKAGQQDIQAALAAVDADANGALSFNDFLHLMRKCDDARDALDLKLELEVAQECGMAAEEVEGFRQIFSEHVDWKGELSLETLVVLLASVVEMSLEAYEQLERIVRDVHPQGRDVARFPQFLQLIRRLTRDNCLHVNDLAARAVRQQQKRAATRSVSGGEGFSTVTSQADLSPV